jgi:carboxyl-terminal processing protease
MVAPVFSQNNIDSDVEKLEQFLKSLDQRYVDSVETASLVEKGIRSMLEELDPHSVYMNPEQYERATEPLSGKFKGIGIRYRVIDDTLTVVEVIKNSPADRGGLLFGDQLVAVGEDTLSGKELSSSAMSKRIKAEINTDKPFTIRRNREDVFTVLDRSNVPVSSVASAIMLSDKTGYIKLTRFSSSSVSDFKKSLDLLIEKGMESLVFDLRGNSGGYLNAAIKITDEFLDDRKLIVYTKGTHQNKKETFANSGGKFTKGDLVVLIDERSASASEIVAGAIQDWDRGLILGRRSYGKGLVQRTIEYDDGSAMRLTISRYYTPTGRSIQKPYDKGLSEYKSDLKKRRLSGELLSSDSIKVNDSLVFYTPNNRQVFGGGGIIPDVFIPSDTARRKKLSKKLDEKGLQYLFAVQYVLKHKDQVLTKYPDALSFSESFKLSSSDLLTLQNMANSRSNIISPEEFEAGKAEASRDIKGIMSRYLYGSSNQYYTLTKYDAAINRAQSEIRNDTFAELGLNQ